MPEPGAPLRLFSHGTRRRVAPAATVQRARRAAGELGVTRLGDISGLDTIGLPVFQAVRPDARSLSVSQGKGATRLAARVSALMEAIELACAERIMPDDVGSREPPDRMAPDEFGAAGDCTAWSRGVDLLSGRSTCVPHAFVSMDYTASSGDVRASSNGLASGNDVVEASVAALAELIERDSHAQWLKDGRRARAASAIDLGTVTDRLGKMLIGRVHAAGFGLRLWDMSAAHAVATIGCAIYELGADAAVRLHPAFGAGTHPSARVALARAITEAAQTRATLIAGARDDLTPEAYADPAAARLRLFIETGAHEPASRPWARLPDLAGKSLEDDFDLLLERVHAAGISRLVRVVLSPVGHELAVVKLLAPGLRDPHGRST